MKIMLEISIFKIKNMKKSVFILLILISLVSCKPYIEYNVSYTWDVPDSLKTEYKQYVQDLVKNSSYNVNLSAGRGKDLGDVVEAATRTANQIYEVQIPILRIQYYNDWMTPIYGMTKEIKFDNLTSEQLEIFNQIMRTGENIEIKLN